MSFVKQIIRKQSLGTDILRITICAILFTHGSYRIMRGETAGLGDFLKEVGVPLGVIVGYLITIMETLGTTLLVLRILALPISIILSVIYFTALILFNSARGFFVVGPMANGGWEYNLLIVATLFATAWVNRKERFFPF